MILIALAVFVLVVYISYDTVINTFILHGIGTGSITIAGVPHEFVFPGLALVWIVLLGAVFLALGTAIFYLDSRNAMDVLRTGAKQYRPLSAKIGDWYWNDMVNTNEYTFIAKYLWRFALAVVVFMVVKYVIGFVLILLANIFSAIAGFLAQYIAMESVNVMINALADVGIGLVNALTTPFGLLGFAVSIVIVVAEFLHRHERGFLDDYAVMQRQRR
ncbi:MAG: hypothetical protein ACK5GU_09590 [Chloroflexota bacterium]|jgi:hypothetical protein